MSRIALIKKGDDVELDIDSIAFGGMGVSKFNDIVTFVKNAIPGQKVIARITKRRSSYLEARSIETIRESPYHMDATCEHFSDCGGCTFQNLNYTQQLYEKASQINDIFKRLGGFNNYDCDQIVGCDKIFHYRNKMEFTFSNREYIPEAEIGREPYDFSLGLHPRGVWYKVIDINNCYLHSPLANEILQFVKKITIKLKPYDVRRHSGFLRGLIIRTSENTDDIMINFITKENKISLLEPIVKLLIKKFPQITSIINNINSSNANISLGESQNTLYGKNFIIEKLGKYNFIISPDSFFQVNTKQAKLLYDIIVEEANLTGKEIVYDLFCGTGSIALYLSQYAKHIYGFEIVESAIKDAKQNALNNKINNVSFFEGNLESIFRKNLNIKNLDSPDVIVIDPPRAGLHPKTVMDVLEKAPSKIVYISCNPASQARDVSLFCKSKYKLIKLRPVDMFPHTPHIENIATLIYGND